jgi:uncharacterized membrane protein YgdD (TMEM256/DUF423 family)
LPRLWIGLGALAGLLAVAVAAAAAHVLPGRVGPGGEALVQSGLRMQGWHALALLFVGLWSARGGWLADAAAVCFVLGIVLFCGAVYALAFGHAAIEPLAPVGGTLLMLGWLLLGLSALRPRRG